jgi:hypothetical protein
LPDRKEGGIMERSFDYYDLDFCLDEPSQDLYERAVAFEGKR